MTKVAQNKRQSIPLGKTRLVKLLKEGVPLKVFHMSESEYKAFNKEAHKRKIRYAHIYDRKTKEYEVIARAGDIDMINPILNKMGYGKRENLNNEDAPDESKKKENQRGDESERPSSGSRNTPRTETAAAGPEMDTPEDGIPAFMRNRTPPPPTPNESPERNPDTATPIYIPSMDSPSPDREAPAEPESLTDYMFKQKTPEDIEPRTAAAPARHDSGAKQSVKMKMEDCKARSKAAARKPAPPARVRS